MEYALDPTMALNAAANQDITARRREMESLSHTQSDEQRREKLQEACEGFEAIFIQKMWEQMRATLPKEGLMSSKDEQFWQSMYDQELGKSMASNGGIGLADMMMEQMNRNNQDMSDATRVTTTRRSGLQIQPAPLLTPTSPAAPADPAISPAPVGPPLTVAAASVMTGSSIYDGEAVQPDAPDPDIALLDEILAEPAQIADDTPPSVRQTLDELANLVAAQRQAEASVIAAAPAAPAATQKPAATASTAAMGPSVSTANAVDVRRQFQQMTGEAPYRASSAQAPRPAQTPQALVQPAAAGTPATSAVEAALAEAEQALPTIIRTTYQTNLPSSQRTMSPLQNQPGNYQRQPIGHGGSPVGSTGELNMAAAPQAAQAMGNAQAAGALPTTGPAQAQAPLAAPEPVAVAQTDILTGISPRFVPTRFLAQTHPAQAPVDSFDDLANAVNRPTQAGGPVLRAPEELARPVALGNPAPPKGSMTAPVQGDISSGFGWRIDPFTGQRAWHAGVDIKALPGERVNSAMDGMVTFAGEHPELGHLVVVDHGDGLSTYYGHNQNVDVSVGQQVKAGMELAQAGSSGRAAGTHVHFEVRRGELALNPEPLLQQRNMQVAAAR